MLIVEECNVETTPSLAEMINTCPTLESIGFAKNSFSETVAKMLVDNIAKENSFSGKLTISDAQLQGETSKWLVKLLEKFAKLKTLDVSYNTVSNDAFGNIFTAVSTHATLKTLAAQECHMEGGGDFQTFTAGLSTLFATNTVLETLKLDGVNLFACDSTTWMGLAKSLKSLRKLSLSRCFQNPNAWMEIYKGGQHGNTTSSIMINWTLRNVDSTLDMVLGGNGGTTTTVSLMHSTHSKYKEFDWILPLIRGMTAATHAIVVSPSAMGTTVSAILPDLCACTGVTGLELQLGSHAEALSVVTSFLSEDKVVSGNGQTFASAHVLSKVLPKAAPTLSQVDLSWEVSPTKGRTVTAISIQLSNRV